jgi:hypothetical protein
MPSAPTSDEPDIAGLISLPARADFAEAQAAVSNAFGVLGELESRLGKVGDHTVEHSEFPAGVTADEAYIGMLFDFVECIDVDVAELKTEADQIREHLGCLNDQVRQDAFSASLAAQKAGA